MCLLAGYSCWPGARIPEVVDPTVNARVARGFAVVQTDYQGLGRPGPAPYLVGPVEANDVTYIVGAARHLDRQLSRKSPSPTGLRPRIMRWMPGGAEGIFAEFEAYRQSLTGPPDEQAWPRSWLVTAPFAWAARYPFLTCRHIAGTGRTPP